MPGITREKEEKFNLKNISKLSKERKEREKMERESEVTGKLEKLSKGGLKKEPSADVREALEELRAAEREKIKQEGGKLRKKIVSGEDLDEKFDFSDEDAEKMEEETTLEVTPDQILEQIQLSDKELNKDFTKLEKEWFAKEPEEKKEIIEEKEESTEMFYRNQLDHLHAQDPKKYPSGQEYMESSDTLEYFDQRKQQIELELQNKFGYDVLKGGWWASYKIKRKLDPDDGERFEKLLTAYKNTDKSYRERLKKHMKKYSDALELISPRVKGAMAERGRHMELGPPRFY